jgi:hypothetical protein
MGTLGKNSHYRHFRHFTEKKHPHCSKIAVTQVTLAIAQAEVFP